MRFLKYMLLLPFLGFTATAFADELSLLSGFYRSTDADPGNKSQEISLGARYGLAPSEERSLYFFEGRVASTTYSGDNAPDGGSSVSLGFGQLYFFRNFSKAIHSYLSWLLALQSAKDSPAANTETERTGLLYAGSAGFRFDFTKTIFVDMELNLFTSALFETTETKNSADATADQESKRTELYFDSFSGVNDLRFGVGMYF